MYTAVRVQGLGTQYITLEYYLIYVTYYVYTDHLVFQ